MKGHPKWWTFLITTLPVPSMAAWRTEIGWGWNHEFSCWDGLFSGNVVSFLGSFPYPGNPAGTTLQSMIFRLGVGSENSAPPEKT